MNIRSTSFADVLLIEPDVFEDDRGFFSETYRQNVFFELTQIRSFVQDNHSGSIKGTLRGLHYQINQPQGKLLRVISGEIFDVVVDIRQSSPTFSKWLGLYLSSESRQQLWIPPGYAHGFYVTSEWAEIVYKTTEYYVPEWDRTLLWNDPDIGIEWPLHEEDPPVLSDKDARGTALKSAELLD